MLDINTATEHLSQIQAWDLWYQSVDISSKYLMLGISVHNWGRIGKCMQAVAALTVLLDIIGAPAIRRFGKKIRNLTPLDRAKDLMRTGWQLFADIFAESIPDVMFRLDQVIRHLRKLYSLAVIYCHSGTSRDQRSAIIARSYRRVAPSMMNSKKGKRRKTRWRARVFPSSVKFQQFEKKFVRPVAYSLSAIIAVFYFSIEYHEGFAQGILQALFTTIIIFFLALIAIGSGMFAIHVIAPLLLVVSALLGFMIDIFLIRVTARILEHPKNENMIKAVAMMIFLTGFYFDLLAS